MKNLFSSEVPANGQIIEVDLSQIKVREGRPPLNEANVERIRETMPFCGLMHPPTVTENEQAELVLISGYHRIEAARREGWTKVFCLLVEADDLTNELREIEENFSRNTLTASEYARLALRRAQIWKELVAVSSDALSQSETGSKRAVGSIRDQAEKTGEGKDKLQRALKIGQKLGPDVLRRTRNTSLDQGVELDALTRLPAEEVERLLLLAEAGERVSARTFDRRPKKRSPRGRQNRTVAQARSAFEQWRYHHPCVEKLAHLKDLLDEIQRGLSSEGASRSS